MDTDGDVVTVGLPDFGICWPFDASVVDVVVVANVLVAVFGVVVILFDVVSGLLFIRGEGDLLAERMVSVRAR